MEVGHCSVVDTMDAESSRMELLSHLKVLRSEACGQTSSDYLGEPFSASKDGLVGPIA